MKYRLDNIIGQRHALVAAKGDQEVAVELNLTPEMIADTGYMHLIWDKFVSWIERHGFKQIFSPDMPKLELPDYKDYLKGKPIKYTDKEREFWMDIVRALCANGLDEFSFASADKALEAYRKRFVINNVG